MANLYFLSFTELLTFAYPLIRYAIPKIPNMTLYTMGLIVNLGIKLSIVSVVHKCMSISSITRRAFR